MSGRTISARNLVGLEAGGALSISEQTPLLTQPISEATRRLVAQNDDIIGRGSVASMNSRLLSRRAMLRKARFNLETHQETIFDDDELRKRNLWQTFKTRLPYYLPIIQWMGEYRAENFKHDFFAGLTVASLMVPQCLAYPNLIGLPANHILSAGVFGLLVYSIFGTSRQLSNGPDAVICVMIGQQLTGYSHHERFQAATTITLLVGIISVVMGLLRLGFIDSILSRCLLKGFVFAVATQIIFQQMSTLLGFNSHPIIGAATVELALFIFEHLAETNLYTVAISLPVCAFLLGFNALKKQRQDLAWLKVVPGILLVVVLSTFLSWQLNVKQYGVAILGHVQPGLVAPTLPLLDLRTIEGMLPGAGVVVLVGFVQSIAVCKIYANKYEYRTSANRELVALGCSSVASSFFGQVPVFASLSRSRVNDQAGAVTQAAGAVCGLFLLLTMLFLMPLFTYLPRAVLASVIAVAASSMLEASDVGVMIHIRAWKEGAMLLLTYTVTVCLGLTRGIIVSTCISLLLVVQATTIPRFQIMGRTRDANGKIKYRSVEEFPEAECLRREGLLVLRIEQSLNFANMGQMKDNLRRIEQLGRLHVHPTEKASHPALRTVVFDLQSVVAVDASAVQILYEIVEQYQARNVEVFFVQLRSSNVVPFTSSGLIEAVGSDHIFNKVSECVAAVSQRSRHCLPCDGRAPGPPTIVFSQDFEEVASQALPEGQPGFDTTKSGFLAR